MAENAGRIVGLVVKTGTADGNRALNASLSVLMFVVLFLSVPEVVLRDFLIGSWAQRWLLDLAIVLLFVLVVFQLTANSFRLSLAGLAAWLLLCACVLLAFLSNRTVVMVLILQPTLIFLVAIVLQDCDWSRYSRLFLIAAVLMCLSPLISFVVHYLTPFNVVARSVFTDYPGHTQNIVFISFSPSIHTLGSLNLPRLSGILDEPGTFGFFASMFGALLYWKRRYGLARLVFCCGLVSVSTAYLLFFALTVPVWLAKRIDRTLIGVLVLIALALVLSLASPGAFGFFGTRMLYAFGENNRTQGWLLAIESLKTNPLFGTYLAGYATRAVGASGILVMIAYFGVLGVGALLLLVLGELFRQARTLDYPRLDWKSLWVVGAAVAMTIANRNNFFNYSGFTLSLFAMIAASAPRKTPSVKEAEGRSPANLYTGKEYYGVCK